MNAFDYAVLIGAAAIAGAVNSVAGGGTMLTFPALMAADFTTKFANATSTVALWPGQLSSLWGLRGELGHTVRAVVPLLVIGLIGGGGGAWLLLVTPSSIFDKIVPFLVLLATALFMVQEPLARWQKSRVVSAVITGEGVDAATGKAEEKPLHFSPGIVLFLLGVAVYGGYFGAGIGILTLAALGLMGLTNLHQMNAIKAVFTLGVNGVAVIMFICNHLVDWKIAGIMAIGALFGGYAGAGIARRIGQKNVRRVVIAIGLILTLSLLRRLF